MAFSVPFGSSPPTTPEGGRAGRGRGRNALNSVASGPSTTPLGPPPPSSAASFTPADPPPSSIFGSSQLGSQRSLFESKANGNPRSSPIFPKDTGVAKKTPLFGDSSASAVGGRETGRFPAPRRTHLSSSRTEKRAEYALNKDTEATLDLWAQDAEPSDQGMDLDAGDDRIGSESKTSGGMSLYDWTQHGTSLQSTRSPKARRAAKVARTGERRAPSYSALYSNPAARNKLRPSLLPTIAKSTAHQLGTAELSEPQSLIMETEQEIRRIYPESNDPQEQNELLDAALRVIPDTLARAWQRCCKENASEALDEESHVSIGPPDGLPFYHKASFIASLLLKLHHPPAARGKQSIPQFRSSRATFESDAFREEYYPKILLQWLNEYHNPFAEVMFNIKAHQPTPPAHPSFWDVILSLILRGRLKEASVILLDSNFADARTAAEDGFTNGYFGSTLYLIDREIKRAARVLIACPAETDDDWNLRSYAWGEFRLKVEDALKELASTLELTGAEPSDSAFDASKLTTRSMVSDFIKPNQQIGNKTPRTIFRNLKELYSILLGKTNELLAAAQDWVEAAIAMTAWWDGEGDDELLYSLSTSQSSRLIEIDPAAAYRKRLADAFQRATGEGEGLEDTWMIDTNSSVEIALGSMFEDNVAGVLGLLKSFSLPIATATAEIAIQGRWFQSAAPEEQNSDFDNSDLMVLNYGQTEKPISRNDLLAAYADRLFEVKTLEWNGTVKEGWELAIEILSRMDNAQVADAKMGELINNIDVQSDQRADKLIRLCRVFDLDTEANKVSEKYANTVAETSNRYGTALIYYARAHNVEKVRDVLALLISYSLVQSVAFPPVEQLDPHLSSLLSHPRDSLLWLANLDTRAAEILSINMSGYATLRKFFDIRDEQADGKRLSFARKKAAAVALLAVISSASSSIQGGIYDPESEAVVPFDVVLVLLGEATPFVDARMRYLSLKQLMVLLRAIEDVQTVHPRIRAQCDDALKSALASKRGHARVANPQELLKKSVSGLTGSSGFSLIGESMETDRSGQSGQRGAEEKRRGWDWRDNMQSEDEGDELVGMLRLALAREVARAWLDGEEL